jgi:CubicO group peptidase (beta-lactamase class C family)
MNTNKKPSVLNKLLKRLLYLIIALFVFINLFIVLSGRTYLYNGIRWTYLVGKSGPTIYDSLMTDERVLTPSGKHYFEEGDRVSLNEEFLTELESYKTKSFLILKNNQLVFEKYWDDHTENTKSNSFSVAKSVVGLLFGIARDKGIIDSFDEPVSSYLPDLKGYEGKVTIKHLLMMASGMSWEESGNNPFSDNAEAYYGYDLQEFITSKEFESVPDNKFIYKSGNTQVLAMILEKAAGMNISEFASEHLWSKIGTKESANWELDRAGEIERAYCCLYATTRDFAAIGQLILNEGLVNNEQIIKKETLNELTSISYAREGSRKNWSYGLHFWILDDPKNPVIYARGIQGQYILAIPSLDIVIVRTGEERGSQLGGLKDNRYGSIERYMRNHPRDVFLYLDIAKSLAQ